MVSANASGVELLGSTPSLCRESCTEGIAIARVIASFRKSPDLPFAKRTRGRFLDFPRIAVVWLEPEQPASASTWTVRGSANAVSVLTFY